MPLIMPTHAKLTTVILCAVTLALAGVGVVRAADEGLDEATKARIAKAEQGPATIDVSKYPQPIQEGYETFSQKCTQCHKLSRPVNSDYCIPAEWERYVKRMMHKPGSGINSTDAKKIFEFLVYDSSVRKKALLDEKLAKATPEEKDAAEKKIKEVHDKYDK
jgi:cytochrome c5